MQGRRHDRVRELLKRELSTLLLREFPIASAGLITVNEVKVSGDLKSALVYVGIVAAPDVQRRSMELLREHRSRLQGMLGHAVALRYTPELRFVMDDSVARGNRILQILDDIEKSNPSAPA
jgi:ribosome-binding factor A